MANHTTVCLGEIFILPTCHNLLQKFRVHLITEGAL